ncbi:MAG: Txe/YoeB family addiction module toxin [Saprospiraceae bacterium]
MNTNFQPKAMEDIAWWAENNVRMLRKIWNLISIIRRTPYEGAGQPEQLKYHLAGTWSRRIDQEHRLVYRVDEDRNEVIIISCKDHYTGL